MFVKFWPMRSVKVAALEGIIRRYESKGIKLDMVIVDYGDLFEWSIRTDDETKAISDTFMRMKGIAGKYGIPIWTPTQTNRGGYSKAVVDLDDIGKDFSKAQLADVVIALCQTKDEKSENQMRFYMAKVREERSKCTFMSYVDYDLKTVNVYAEE